MSPTRDNRSDGTTTAGGIDRRSLLRYAVAGGTAAVALPAVSPLAAAAELVVDAGGGGDHTTIQGAVDAATDGDTITVLPGTYDSGDDDPVEVSTPNLTIRGDPGDMGTIGAGPDAPDALSFTVLAGADGTSIHGFSLEGDSGTEGDALWVDLESSDSLSGVTASHNDMTGFVEVDLGPDVTLDGLDVSWNDMSGNDVDIDFEGTDATLTDARITNNRIVSGDGDVVLPELNTAGADAELLIRCNEIVDAEFDAIEFNLSDGAETSYDIRVHNNTIDGAGESGIEFRGSVGPDATVDIRYNEFLNCTNYGIENDDGTGDVSGITVAENDFVGNAIGVKNNATTVLDARDNWWGDASGPGAENNEEDADTGEPADGAGDTVYSANDTSIRFDPWLESAVDRPECEQDAESDGDGGVGRRDAGRDTPGSDVRDETEHDRRLLRRSYSRGGNRSGGRSGSSRRNQGR